MKKPIITALLVLLGLAVATKAHAEDYAYPYLTFKTTSGVETSVSVESLVMTVSNGQLVIQNSDKNTSFDIVDLDKMYFSSIDAGIASISADNANDGVEIYSLTGITMGKFSGMDAAQTSLAPGIYIVRNGNKITKLAVK